MPCLMAPLRWGICAYGLIASDFATALSISPENHVIAAVGGRDPKKAEEFATKFKAKRSVASWQELATCSDVDVVYVASLTNLHYEHTKYFLEAGKPVLCEKPLTLSAEQTRELLQLAKSRGLFLMLGMWSRFFPLYQRLRAAIDSGELGEVRMVQANFCLPNTSEVERLNDLSKGGGCLADFGVYLVHLACWVYRSERPQSIAAVGHLFPSGADRSGSVTLKYSDNRLAVLNFSTDCGALADAHILGEKGTARLGDLVWCPTKLTLNGQEFHEPTPQAEGKFNFFECGGLLYEADHVKECLDKGLTESPVLPHSDCQLIHDILEEGYRQLGVRYF